MRKLSAHYIFDGNQFHKLAILVLNENLVASLEESEEPYVEKPYVEFHNGVICFDSNNKSDIILLENFDMENFQMTENTTVTVLVHRS